MHKIPAYLMIFNFSFRAESCLPNAGERTEKGPGMATETRHEWMRPRHNFTLRRKKKIQAAHEEHRTMTSLHRSVYCALETLLHDSLHFFGYIQGDQI